MKVELVHSFPVSRDVYEKNINHPDLLKMCEGRLPYLKSRTLMEAKDLSPTQKLWKFRCEADYKMPEAARRVIGDRLGWIEESVFDKQEHVVKFKVVPDVLAGRYRCEGEQIFADIDPNSFDRIMTVDVTIDILLVGRTVEKHICEKLQETYKVEYEIQKEFFAKLAKGDFKPLA